MTTVADRPQASVVVATVGRPERLSQLVDAVLADPGTLDLVVVVDGDDPASTRLLHRLAADRPRLKPVTIDHVGHLGALEEGVRRADGDVVVLLDDDVLPDRSTIAGHAAHHQDTPGLVVAGPMPVAPPVGGHWSTGTRLYATEYDSHVAALRGGDRRLLDALWAGNLSMRRSDCLRAGLRSDDFATFYHSDRDLGYRLAAAGLVGRFDPRLTASHLHDRSDAAFLRDARRQGAGQAELHRVHPDRLGPFSPDLLVADLPAPLRTTVRLVGPTRAAPPVASFLMAAGRWSACLTARGRWPGRWRHVEAQLAAAKLARRVMQWQGAVAGEPR